MTKRAEGKYDRRERDFYSTDRDAVLRVVPHLKGFRKFCEPMCGDGAIVRVLEEFGWECVSAFDIEPRGEMIERAGVLDVHMLVSNDLGEAQEIVSNPPWPLPRRNGFPTVEMLDVLRSLLPTWVILSADFKHNRYAEDLMRHCTHVVSAGRVSWMANGKGGYDNGAWYRFVDFEARPTFFGNEGAVTPIHRELEGLV